ncbi:hypothetical protein E2562_002592 [Oryza meyeriana var. granulata]|uniref:Uncharacterized protein n=1 Tax=Oryza meyeriana var. granulata TaxID=110450 RepID=A0A6G1F2Y6_9ORYZ|nr:hypothetical protein E2562_002592 [Oryza meyeriana var. granulata]
MELLLLPSRGAVTHPRRVTGVSTARPAAASSSNVEVIDTTATAAAATPGDVAKNRQEWRSSGRPAGGLGLNLSEDMRSGMMWRMLAPPAAAVAAEAAFLRLLDGAASDAPAWAGAAGSAVLFAVGLLGFHYGFLSSRWDAAERGSLVGWELALRHWNELSMANNLSMDDEESDVDEEEEDEEEDDEDSD